MGAVGSFGVGAADFGAGGGAAVAGGAAFAHEVVMRNDGGSGGEEAVTLGCIGFEADEGVFLEEVRLGRFLEEVTLFAVGGAADAGGFEMRIGGSESEGGSGLTDFGVADGATGAERRMGDDGWRTGVGAARGADCGGSEGDRDLGLPV